MKHNYLRRSFAGLLCLMLLFTMFAESRFYRKAAMYIAAESVEKMGSDQEKNAAKLFKEYFGKDGEILTPKDVDKISRDNYDFLWIQIDSTNVSHSTEAMRQAFTNPIFYQRVDDFVKDGGNLYMTMFAIQLLTTDSPGDGGGLGLIPDYLGPNIISADLPKTAHSIWCVNAEIGANDKNREYGANDKNREYYDHRDHPIYAGLDKMGSNQWEYQEGVDNYENLEWGHYDVFPMVGKKDRTETDRHDHNCMWQLAPKTGQAKVGVCIGYKDIHDRAQFDTYINEMNAGNRPVMSTQERLQIDYILRLKESLESDPNSDSHIEIICPWDENNPGDVDRLSDINNFDVLWIHIDRCDYSQDDAGNIILPPAFTNQKFLRYIKNFVRKGGDLYLSKHATLLLPIIGRIDNEYKPNLVGADGPGTGNDDWEINAATDFYDQREHAIYNNLSTATNDNHEVYPLYGTGDSRTLSREDHNCCWDLNAYTFTADGRNNVDKFQNQNNCLVLGTWGQVMDDAVATIVEFHPTNDYRGVIIANGASAYQWAPDDDNAYRQNMENLTYNTLRYLVRLRDIPFHNAGENNVRKFELDANATVLGTWGQDDNLSAAGIVEFHPAKSSNAARADVVVSDEDPQLAEKNKGKAASGTILANGIACTTLAPSFDNNYYQYNSNKLHQNALDYLTPWHSEEVLSGVEDVALRAEGTLHASNGTVTFEGFDQPAVLKIYAIDGRELYSAEIRGEGSINTGLSGTVIIRYGNNVVKARM